MRWFKRPMGWRSGRVKLTDEQLKLLDSISTTYLNQSSLSCEEPNRPPGEEQSENSLPVDLVVEDKATELSAESINTQLAQNEKDADLEHFVKILDVADWVIFFALIVLAIVFFATVEIVKAVLALSSAISVLRTIIKQKREKHK